MSRRILGSLLAGIPAFGYLLYFTGRVYSAAYYSTIGIPKDIARFDFWDYLYFGAKDFNILIPLAFSALFIRFVLYLTEPITKRDDSQSKGSSSSRFSLFFWIFYLVLYVLTLIAVVGQAWFSPTFTTSSAYIGIALMACLSVWLFSIILLSERPILARIKKGRVVSQLFIGAVVTALVLLPNTSADAWGRLEGTRAKDNYPFVELYAPYQIIDDIQWELTSNNACRTADDLQLLISNQQYLVVQSDIEGSNLYVVPIDDILYIEVVSPEE